MLNVVLILHVVLIQPFGGGGIPFHFGGRGFFPFEFFMRSDFFDMFDDGRYHNSRYGHNQSRRCHKPPTYHKPRRSYHEAKARKKYYEEKERLKKERKKPPRASSQPQEDDNWAEEDGKGARKKAKNRRKKARKKEREDARWLGKRVITSIKLIKG